MSALELALEIGQGRGLGPSPVLLDVIAVLLGRMERAGCESWLIDARFAFLLDFGRGRHLVRSSHAGRVRSVS